VFEMAFLFLTILLSAFALLAVIDGFYLHIFKYELFRQKESKHEHLIHTFRAVFFPFIVYFLFIIQNSVAAFYIGVFVVMIDIVTLGIDGFIEKDSRKFMGGLPRWEYILHLFVNGFHFATIAVFLVLKLKIGEGGFEIVSNLSNHENFEMFQFLAVNLLPGSIILALLHVFTNFNITEIYWRRFRTQISCC